jgi:hypothetical protein
MQTSSRAQSLKGSKKPADEVIEESLPRQSSDQYYNDCMDELSLSEQSYKVIFCAV